MEKKRRLLHPRKRQKIFGRDNFKCVNCGVSGDFNALEVDHIIPIIDGGTNEEDNLQTLCYKCNMDKFHKKKVTNKFLLDLSPLERLELVKEKLLEYKHLSYPEFSIVFTQDELFKRLRLDLLHLKPLFSEVSGQIRAKKIKKKGVTLPQLRYREQRDKILYLLRKNSKLSYSKLEDLLLGYDIDITFQQIARICAKFGDVSDRMKEKQDKKAENPQ